MTKQAGTRARLKKHICTINSFVPYNSPVAQMLCSTLSIPILWVRKLRYGKVKGLAEITHLGSSRAEIQTQVTDCKVLY